MSEQKQIKIGAIRYRIVTEKNLVDDDGLKRLDGHIRYSSSEIKLDSALGPQARRQVIWHEVLHGIMTQAGIETHDEKNIEAISHGLMNVLEDNPWLAQPIEEQ